MRHNETMEAEAHAKELQERDARICTAPSYGRTNRLLASLASSLAEKETALNDLQIEKLELLGKLDAMESRLRDQDLAIEQMRRDHGTEVAMLEERAANLEKLKTEHLGTIERLNVEVGDSATKLSEAKVNIEELEEGRAQMKERLEELQAEKEKLQADVQDSEAVSTVRSAHIASSLTPQKQKQELAEIEQEKISLDRLLNAERESSRNLQATLEQLHRSVSEKDAALLAKGQELSSASERIQEMEQTMLSGKNEHDTVTEKLASVVRPDLLYLCLTLQERALAEKSSELERVQTQFSSTLANELQKLEAKVSSYLTSCRSVSPTRSQR